MDSGPFAVISLTPNSSGKARAASASSFFPKGVNDETLHFAPGSAVIPVVGICTFCLDDIVGLFKDTDKLVSFDVRLSMIGALGACAIGIAGVSVILVVFIRCQK